MTAPPLRGGFTTGACATAATKAALLSWLQQRPIAAVAIALPAGDTAAFQIAACDFDSAGATCSVRKDGGDDPDATTGVEIGCQATWRPEAGVVFRAGEGVGMVTLPGLPVPVGEPAINPVPRRMMTAEVHAALAAHGCHGGAVLEVFARGGRAAAGQTLNARLGIIGGISIIGTTGHVRPFSAEAYVASIRSGLDVAAASGCTQVVLNAGGRSEAMLRAQFPGLPPQAFIQYGNWIGAAFDHLRATTLRRATLGLMLGKAVKLATGALDTHSRSGLWDRAFVAGLMRHSGYDPARIALVAELPLARQIGELVPFRAAEPLYGDICAACHAFCAALVPGIDLDIRLHNDAAGWIAWRSGAGATDLP